MRAEGHESLLTQRAKKVVDILERRYELLSDLLPVPFGMMEINASEYQRRWKAMDVQGRLAEIQRLGIDRVKHLLLEA